MLKSRNQERTKILTERDISFTAKERAEIVRLILEQQPERALGILSASFDVEAPVLQMGHVKGAGKALACYVPRKKCIVVSARTYLYDPFVLLHEFYHHLRSSRVRSRHTDSGADAFARAFIEAYEQEIQRKLSENSV